MENENYPRKDEAGTISRRSFSKWSAALAGTSYATGFVNGEDQSSSARSEKIECKLAHGDMQRRYILALSPGHDKRKPAPLILFFHGGGGDADRIAAVMDFHKYPEGKAYAIAYPDGYKGSFNAGPGPDGKAPNWGAAFQSNLDDVGFASAIIDDVASRVSIDLRRVYASGWSNGSAMSFRLACELTDRIAGVAGCYSELSLMNPKLSQPLAMLYCYGTEDPIRRPGSPPKDEMAARHIKTLIRLNGCHPEPARVEQQGHATMTRWEGDHPDAVVIQWRLEGHGHWWPGLLPATTNIRFWGPVASDISATREALKLFANHRRIVGKNQSA
jgi:polyhydroxybutyrate depolymerase